MIFRSPHPDVAVPDIALHRLVLERAAERGTKPALIDGPSGRILTYAALTRGADRVAAGLAARGFKKGDVLGLFTPNLPEFALVFHGTLAAGGVVTTINSLATEQDVEHQLRNAGARVLVTVPPFLDRAAPAASKLGIDQLFVLGEAVGTTPFAALLATDAPAPEVTINPARDLAVLPYSSGTTGFPKGVMLTHRNLVANLLQTGAVHTLAAEDRVMAVLPFFHLYGMQVVMNLALWYGATLVTMPKFELEPFLGLVQQHRITRAFVVPPIVLALAKHPAVDGYDLSSLRRMMSGAAPLDADGWLHTGDIGRADAAGFFTIVDRAKELIKYKGFQVPPAELEAVLCTHPAVGDAAVIPIPDEACGEVPKAFVVLKEAATAADLMAYVAERVAPYKKIRAVEVIDAIPKSPSGKILRRVLKERERIVRA